MLRGATSAHSFFMAIVVTLRIGGHHRSPITGHKIRLTQDEGGDETVLMKIGMAISLGDGIFYFSSFWS
jgi:hypothetical protein